MEKAIVKKMYRVFDELWSNKELAEKVLEGWGHKEKIQEVYVVGYESLVDNLVIPDLQGVYLTTSYKNALEEMEEMNN